ncbi:MAG: hypothetical protein MR295_05615, partial [Ruminococcus bromii]|nr:hypothetical protein [Ruminococcus bromii]
RMQSVTAESLRSLPGRHKICGIGLLQPEGGNALPAEGPIPVVAVNRAIAPSILRSAVDAVILDVPPEEARPGILFTGACRPQRKAFYAV